MKFWFLFLLILISLAGFGQGSWKVRLNEKTVLNTTVEDEEKNIILLKKSDLRKKKDFTLQFREENKKADWERTLMVYDEKDRELVKQKGNQLKVKNSRLLTYFSETAQLKIYTIALPTDPTLRAAIRVRRVHLCTLVLQ
jgi:hypothetical protein